MVFARKAINLATEQMFSLFHYEQISLMVPQQVENVSMSIMRVQAGGHAEPVQHDHCTQFAQPRPVRSPCPASPCTPTLPSLALHAELAQSFQRQYAQPTQPRHVSPASQARQGIPIWPACFTLSAQVAGLISLPILSNVQAKVTKTSLAENLSLPSMAG
jgi:hypothetical protein